MILAADLGTSSLKAGIISPDGHLEARVRIPYPDPPGLGRQDFDARQWETALKKALSKLPAAKLTAIAFSGNGPTLVPCDARGEPLAPADLWLQDRSLRVDGQDSYYLPKAAWLKKHDHGTWKKTSMLLSCPEWLQYRLTGKAVMVIPHESFRRYVWDPDQLEAYDLKPSLFPETVLMGQSAGSINAEAAAGFGLPEGLPVTAADIRAAWSVEQTPVGPFTLPLLEPGTLAQLTGPNGIGKSTMLSVLARHLTPVSGTHLLSGVPAADVGLADARADIAMVDDEPHAFAGSIRANLALAAPGATDDDLLASLAAADLTRWLQRQPDGLDSLLTGLSGGERTRLAIARAVLSRRRLVLLDEPAAHLDEATAVRALSRLLTDPAVAVVAVSHQPLPVVNDREVSTSAS